MANPIPKTIHIGTLGELLVQLRLLQFDVQAAAPLKDSGNDLIALKGPRCHTVQVKTTANHHLPDWPDDIVYSLLAIVDLQGEGREIFLDRTSVYLIPREELQGVERRWDALEPFRISEELVDYLFKPA